MKAWASFDNVAILSVEDDGFNQELAAAVFEEFPNTKVYRASNGKEALKVIEKNSIDVIMLDLMMPEMDGFETLKILKESDEYNKIPVIVVTSEENEKKSTYKLGANDFISKPYNPEELKLRVFNNLKMKKFCDLLITIRDDLSDNKKISSNHLERLKEAIEIANNSQKQLLLKLGNLTHNNGHKDENAALRVGEYAKLLAKLYGLSSKEVDSIYNSMTIYDIGLLKISKQNLKNEESREFKKHPLLGLEILNDLEETALIKTAKDITLCHHENWDGSGYPNALKKETIPLSARIAAIVDYFDELTSFRVYTKETMNSLDALEIIKRESGRRFEPSLLEIFINNFSLFQDIKNRLT